MNPTDHGWGEVITFLLLTILLFIIIGSSGRVHLGFYNPYFLPPLRKHYRRILRQKFAYYHLLPPKSQKVFEKRLQYFIYQKNFIARGGINKVTDEMKVLIGASAIQITFGLPRVYLKHFEKIIIYPDSYHSTINDQKHKGEVNPKLGTIVLSWHSFLKGYEDETDGVNLGLHEMAHALELENLIRNEEYDFISHEDLQFWNEKSQSIILSSSRHEIFRAYAFTNKEEFFAASVELFFEKPVGLRDFDPSLYSCMCSILKQDPIALRG